MTVTDTPVFHGNCFEVAAGVAMPGVLEEMANGRPLVLGEKSPWRIVHGLPVGTAGPPAGRRYWHAWVEHVVTLRDASTVMVHDYSNEGRVVIPRVVYYDIGQLDEAHVWRYTPAEARRILRKIRHCGPWVHGWETMDAL